MATSRDSAELAKIHARLRRRFNWLWFGMAVVVAGACTTLWAFTGNIYDRYAALFYAAFPLIGLFVNHFVLLNPWRDPLKTQQRLEKLGVKERKNTRSGALINGLILVISWPVILFLSVGAGAREGILELALGALVSMVWLVGGLLSIAYWWRTRPTRRDS